MATPVTPYSIPNTTRYPGDFSEDKYSVQSTMYPDDLLGGDYGGNYVVFNINVNVDSKLLKTSAPGSETVDGGYDRIRGYVNGGSNPDQLTRSSAGMIAASQAETYVGAITGGIAMNKIGSAVKLPGAMLKTLTAGVVGGGAFGTLALGALKYSGSTTNTRAQKRLKAAIALGMPENLAVSYQTNWEESSVRNSMIADKLGDQLKGSFEALTHMGTQNPLPALFKRSKELSAAFASLGLAHAGGTNFASAATGTASNPMKEQIFKGAEMRNFEFTYSFFPRTRQEAQNVQNIIYLFKYHMLPEFLDEEKFLFVYPSEFDITYYKDGVPNANLFRHTSLILKGMDVDYTPNQMFNTFEDGSPTSVKMRLSFTELLPVTKDLVAHGA